MGYPWSNSNERKKIVANRGVPRNKKPLQNKVYKVYFEQEVREPEKWEQYKFKDLGYLIMEYGLEKSGPMYWHGPIEPSRFKQIIGEKQWSKFCQGKREFIIQRRIDGNNVKKTK